MAIAGVDVHGSVDGLRFDAAVTCVDVEIGVFGHVDDNAEVAMAIHAEEAPMADHAEAVCEASLDGDSVAVLTSVNAEVLVQLIAVVFDAEIDLLGVAGADVHGAVVGFHLHLGMA